MATSEIIAIECRWCGQVFCLCRSCYRGHAYCSDRCRKPAREAQVAAAHRRHREKQQAQAQQQAAKANAQRQQRYRERNKGQPDERLAQKVTDQGTQRQKALLSDEAETAPRNDGAPVSDSGDGPWRPEPATLWAPWAVGSVYGRCQRCGAWGKVVRWLAVNRARP
jgi:hypothetical protein